MVDDRMFIVMRMEAGEEVFDMATDDEDEAFDPQDYDIIVYGYYKNEQVERTEVKAKEKPLHLCDFAIDKLPNILDYNKEIKMITILTDAEGEEIAKYNLGWCEYIDIDYAISYDTAVTYYEYENGELKIYVVMTEDD